MDSQHGEHHQRDFCNLAPHDHVALAETVGQVTCRRGKKKVRQNEANRTGHQHAAGILGCKILFADADDQPASDAVVSGP